MPTYRNDGNKPIVVAEENAVITPGEEYQTELILDGIPGLTRIDDLPVWAPTTWYNYNPSAADEQFHISVSAPRVPQYFGIVVNTCGVYIYFNNETNLVLDLPAGYTGSISLNKKVKDIYVKSQDAGEIKCVLSTEPLQEEE